MSPLRKVLLNLFPLSPPKKSLIIYNIPYESPLPSGQIRRPIGKILLPLDFRKGGPRWAGGGKGEGGFLKHIF
jgi:hypothetical protein